MVNSSECRYCNEETEDVSHILMNFKSLLTGKYAKTNKFYTRLKIIKETVKFIKKLKIKV